MTNPAFLKTLQKELERLDQNKVSKRQETVIDGFSTDPNPRALIDGKEYQVFNSNDYLGLRHHPSLKKADHQAVETYGTGPGAVRFISGSLRIYRELEKALARFHGRDDAIVFSSAFATNVAVIPCLIKGQSKDSLVDRNSLVISDALNHRSIIEGIRAASIDKSQKAIFKHLDHKDLDVVLSENAGKFSRAVVVTDGIFSMLGEYQDLAKLKQVTDKWQDKYEEGVILVVDDAHGVGCFGTTGRGVEEKTKTQADVLVGTLGKAFGADGGYVVADQVAIDYLRESAATYVYSNSISPGTAGAGLKAVEMMMSDEGSKLLQALEANITHFQKLVKDNGLRLAAQSQHPIQPLLIGDPSVSKKLSLDLYQAGFLVTSINYPVVPKGQDEIRIQLSATQTQADLDNFVEVLSGLV